LELKVRSLGDTGSVPYGYPNTLAAAIDLAAETLKRTESEDVASVAGDIMAYACYVAGQRIPVHLLVASRDPNLDTVSRDYGPVIIEHPVVPESVRALRRISFVQPGQPLPRRQADRATAEFTITVNTIVQSILRSRIEKSSDFGTWKSQLVRLASHVERWLSAAAHNHEAEKADVLIPHTATLIDHMRRLEFRNNTLALLIGNLAVIYLGTARAEQAAELFEVELAMLLTATDGYNEYLEYQTRMNLATALCSQETTSEHQVGLALLNLERVLAYAQEMALDRPVKVIVSCPTLKRPSLTS